MVKVPIIQWVWTYKMEYFISDIVAGITVAILHVPQGTVKHIIIIQSYQ